MTSNVKKKIVKKKVAKKKTDSLPKYKITYELMCEYFESEKDMLDLLIIQELSLLIHNPKSIKTQTIETLYNSLRATDIADILIDNRDIDLTLTTKIIKSIQKLLLPIKPIIDEKIIAYCRKCLKESYFMSIDTQDIWDDMNCYPIIAALEYEFDNDETLVYQTIGSYKKLAGATEGAKYEKDLNDVIRQIVTYDVFKAWVIKHILNNHEHYILSWLNEKNKPTNSTKETKEQILAKIRELEKQIQNAC